MGAAAGLPAPAPAHAALNGGFVAVGPTSSPDMLFARDPDVSVRQLPIRRTNDSDPVVLYSVQLSPDAESSSVDVRSMTQAAFCRRTDIAGSNDPDAVCKGTRTYDFTPRFAWKVVLADSPTDTEGRAVLQDWRSVKCPDVVHHCPVPVRVDGAAVSGTGLYVNLVATGQHREARRGQVLSVSHGVMQVIQRTAPPEAEPQEALSGPVASSFPMSPGSSRADRDDVRPALLFTQSVEVQEGDVLDVRTQMRMEIRRSQDNAPLTATFAYLTDDPADVDWTRGRGEAAAFKRAGENCPKACSFTRLGAIRSPVSGSMHVNVVAFVNDHEYKTKGFVGYEGSLSVTKR